MRVNQGFKQFMISDLCTLNMRSHPVVLAVGCGGLGVCLLLLYHGDIELQ
jgi:hypothetical protein